MWWDCLDPPTGTQPGELDGYWFPIEAMHLGVSFYVPRIPGGLDLDVTAMHVEVVTLHDFDGRSLHKIGARLYPHLSDGRTTARARLRSTRAQLAAAGVLPWAAWPGGCLPAQWWTAHPFAEHVAAWRTSAIDAADAIRFRQQAADVAVQTWGGMLEAFLGMKTDRTEQLPADVRQVIATATTGPHVTVGSALGAIERRLADRRAV